MNRRTLHASQVCLVVVCLMVPSVMATAGEVSVTSKSSQAVEAFKSGRQLFENLRQAEAEAQLRKAIGLDPDFALAHAYLGAITPGAEGDRLLDRAATLSAKLPEPERLVVESFVAFRRGEEEKARAAQRRVAELAPDDWRAQFAWGGQLSAGRMWSEAAAAFRKATQLNPKAGPAYNSLGYAELAQGHNDEAIAAFKKYAEANPTEPNAQDSLGEALMRAARFDEAEAAFKQALEISPRFWNAWEGISKARFLRGDAAGSYEALARARETASRPIDKIGTQFDVALSQFAEGKKAEALKTFAQAEKDAQAGKVDVLNAFVPVSRALVLTDSGQGDEALKQLAVAMDRGTQSRLPGGAMNALRRATLVGRIEAEARLGKADAAQKTLALVEAEAKTAPANAQLQSNVHFARGSAALARGDATAAAAHFAVCNDDDTYCQWYLFQAQAKMGDVAGADATRRKLLAANRRDGVYLVVRSQLAKQK
jgi:tetratricopeptide (TPR) repeat protein